MSKTCIFTLWRVGKRAFLRILQRKKGKIRQKRAFSTPERVGKRAFLRILQWENGKIRQKRAFSPSGEWENVHFCTFYSGKTAKYVKNVHFYPLESGKTCMSAPHVADAPRHRVHAKYVKNVHFHPLASGKTCISVHSTVGKRRYTS